MPDEKPKEVVTEAPTLSSPSEQPAVDAASPERSVGAFLQAPGGIKTRIERARSTYAAGNSIAARQCLRVARTLARQVNDITQRDALIAEINALDTQIVQKKQG